MTSNVYDLVGYKSFSQENIVWYINFSTGNSLSEQSIFILADLSLGNKDTRNFILFK